MKRIDCKCCEEIEFWKKANNETDKKIESKHKIFAKIAIYAWRKGQRCTKGKQASTIIGKAYDLNYCPKCRKEGEK